MKLDAFVNSYCPETHVYHISFTYSSNNIIIRNAHAEIMLAAPKAEVVISNDLDKRLDPLELVKIKINLLGIVCKYSINRILPARVLL